LKELRPAHTGRVTVEPGVDRAEWEAEWQALEPQLADSPAESLPELDALVERMLTGRGHELSDPVANGGEERELVTDFLSAREVTQRWERGDEVPPGDVAAAVNNYRELYDSLITD
jgi:hypothetical protein